MAGFDPKGALMKKLGKYKTGKGCLYFKRLENLDVPILKKFVAQSVKKMSK